MFEFLKNIFSTKSTPAKLEIDLPKEQGNVGAEEGCYTCIYSQRNDCDAEAYEFFLRKEGKRVFCSKYVKDRC